MRDAAESQHRFRRIAMAGIFFQGGAAAVDTSTIIATLTYGLTGSTAAVGAAGAAHPKLFLTRLFSPPVERRRLCSLPQFIACEALN